MPEGDSKISNESAIICCVHSGAFHSDEIMACALLRLAAGSSHVCFIRSRVPKDWARSDFVIDVGGQYDAVKFFDHHQANYNEKRADGTGYSAFGLLWKSMGITMLREILLPLGLEQAMIVEVAEDMEDFVRSIDLHDQAQLNVSGRWSMDKSVYAEVATVQTIISGMNPVPFLESSDTATANQQFYRTIEFSVDFLRRLVYRKASKVMAKRYVESRIKDTSPILCLEQYCDWYDMVVKAKHIQYVITPSANGKAFAVQAVKDKGGKNDVSNLRVPFPKTWAGLNGEQLAKVTNIPGALFCHRDQFIASATTLADAQALAELSIKLHKNESNYN